MATYTWKDAVLTVDFETEGFAPLTFDLGAAPDTLKNGAAMFGVSTIVRNSTAGKMDDIPAAYALAKAKIAVLASGVIVAKGEAKAKLELTDAEKSEVIAQVIVEAKQAKGDKRERGEIVTAFKALPEAKQGEVLASLAKLIDKGYKAKLKQKKDAAKSDAGTW